MMDVLLNILIISGIGLAVTASYALINYMRMKIENQYVNEFLDIVTDTVDELSQTYVKSLKDAGTFTAEEQQKVLHMAINQILANLTNGARTYLENNSEDVMKFITTKIESYLWRSSGRGSMMDELNELLENTSE